MKRKNISNLISILLTLVCLLNVFVPALAAETTTEVKQTEVLFVCKIEDGIDTDDYSPVVVKLLNEDEGTTSTYKLYKYNKFCERYMLDNGRYSIIYAYIAGRSDVIFDVVADDIYEIGHENTISFELNNTDLLSDGKQTTKATTTTTTTTTKVTTTEDPTELNTLFPVITTSPDETTTDTDTTDVTEVSSENEEITTEKETSTEIYNETTTKENTSDQTEGDTFQGKLAKAFIITAILVLLGILAFAILYTKKRKE